MSAYALIVALLLAAGVGVLGLAVVALAQIAADVARRAEEERWR